jgi:uncharacterized membrane protein (DUF106 family)
LSNLGRKSGGIGSSQILLYVLLIGAIFIAVYYVVIPALYPPAPAGSSGATISLNPSTNIVGTNVTIAGKGLHANTTVTAQLNSLPLSLGGTCETTTAGDLAGCTFTIPKLSSGSYAVTVSDGSKSVHATLSIPSIVPPESTLVVTLTSVALGVVTQVVTRRFVDLKAERKMKAEISQYQADLKEAVRTKDKAKEEKLKKKQLAINQMNTKLSTARLRVTAITFVPFIVLYYVMAGFLGGFSVVVANSPIPIPILVSSTGTMPLFWWYSISSLTFSPMLTKLFGTTT